jgi:hypothetical protein
LSTLTGQQISAINGGLQNLATLGTNLNSFGQLASPLPVVNQSISQVLNLGQTLASDLQTRAATYLQTSSPTTDGLAAALTLSNPNDTVMVTPTVDASGLHFHAVLDVTRSATPGIDLGPQAAALGLGLSTSVTVNLQAELKLDFFFDINTSNAFSLHLNSAATRPFALLASVAATNLQASASVGFLGASISNGTLTLNGEVDVAFSHSPVTAADLASTSLGGLVTLTPSGSLTGSLPLQASLGNFTPASTTLTISSGNLFNGAGPTITTDTNFNALGDFSNLSASQLLSNLNQLGTWFNQFSGTSVFSTPIPFARGQTLGSVLNLGTAVLSKFGLGTDPNTVPADSPLQQVRTFMGTQSLAPSFQTAQDLVSKLAMALGVNASVINPQYDPASKDLTFHVHFTYAFPELSVPLDFSLNLAPLGGIGTATLLALDGNVTIDFTFGANLGAATDPELTTPAGATIPARLTGDARFQLAIDNQRTSTITIRAADTASNTTLAQLVGNINAALTAAGVTTVTAEVVSGNRIGLKPVTPHAIKVLQIFTVPGDPTDSTNPVVGDLQFANGLLSRSRAGELFIKDATPSGSVSLSASNLMASARLGFVDIHASGGSATGTAGVSVTLRDPSTGQTRISLTSLFTNIGGVISTSFAAPVFSGSATVNLPNITVDAGFLALTGNPSVTITLPDITNPSSVQVTLNSDLLSSALNKFQHLSFADITSGLVTVDHLLGSYPQLGFLNQKLPVIDKSVTELLDYANSFAMAINQALANPAGAVQEIQDKLNAAFPGNPVTLTYDPSMGGALLIDLGFTPAPVGIDLPLNLDLNTLASLVSGGRPVDLGTISQFLSTTGTVHVSADASLHVSLGIDLSDPLHPRAFLNNTLGHTTAVTIGANVRGQNLGLSLAVGPFGLAVQNGSATLNDGSADPTRDATFTLGLTSGRHDLSTLSASDIQVSLTAGASVSLPLFVQPGNLSLGMFSVTIPDLNGVFNHTPGSVMITTPDLRNVFGNVTAFSLLQNPSVFFDGLDTVLATIQNGLSSQVFATNLPLIGTHLSDVANFVENLRESHNPALHALRVTLQNELNPMALATDVQNALFDAFGPGGLGILEPAGRAGTGSLSDILISYLDASGNPVSPTSSNLDAIQLNLHLGQGLDFDIPISADLGLPGLGIGLTAMGMIHIRLGWDVRFGFGVSARDGFYLDTSQAVSPQFSVGLAVTAPGLDVIGRLGILQIEATDDPLNHSSFSGGFTAGIRDPGGSSRLKVSTILAGASLGSIVSANLGADANVNLKLTASFGDNANFPKITSDFVLTWRFGTDTGLAGARPHVAFNNVTLDLGTFISNFARPIINEVDKFIEPIRPVVDFLTMRLPVISDLAGQDTSILDLAVTFGGGNPTAVHAFEQAVHLVEQIIDLVRILPVGSTIQISLGSFDLDDPGIDLRHPGQALRPMHMQSASSIDDQLNRQGADANTRNFVRMIGATGGSVSFPILSNPASAFGLFLGQTADLVRFDLPTLTAGFTYSQAFEIFGPLVALITGSASITAHATIVYDTLGLQEFFNDHNALDLLDGFYIVADGTPNITINAGLSAGVALDLGIIDGGVAGGIFATINISLHDPDHDGKLRFKELEQEIVTMPQCLFDLSGRLFFRLYAFLDVNLFFFSIHKQFNIVPATTLFDFSLSCPRDPVLATDLGGGVLRLNMGPHAGDRQNGNTTDGDENFEVSHVSGTPGNETVDVTAFGVTQRYSGVSRIVADTGVGNDVVTIDAGVLAAVDFSGTTGNKQFTDHGSGAARFSGGTGTNTFVGGTGTNTVVQSGDYDYNLSNSQLTFSSGGSVRGTDNLTNIQRAILTGGGGPNTFTISNWSGDATLDGAEGSDTYIINTGSGATVHIHDTGTSGTDRVMINGTAAATSYTIGQTQTTTGSDTIQYDNTVEVLTVTGAAANNTFLVNGTLAGSTIINTGNGTEVVNVQATNGALMVATGNGTSTVNVGDRAPAAGGILNNAQGAVTVTGGAGGATTLNVDDTGSSGPKTGTLTPTMLTGLGMAGITYSNLAALNIMLGSGGNTFTINDIAPSTPTLVDGGLSSNDRVSATFAQDFAGTLTLVQFENATVQVTRDFLGTLTARDPGPLQQVTIGRSLAASGRLLAGSLDTMTVTQDVAGMVQVSGAAGTLTVHGALTGQVNVGADFTSLAVDHDLSGTVDVTGTLGTMTVGGSLSGQVSAGVDLNTLNVTQDVSGMVQVTRNIDTATVGSSVSGLISVGGDFNSLSAGQDVSGSILVTGLLNQTTLGGSVTVPGIVSAAAINTMSVGLDVAGHITAAGDIGTLAAGRSVTYQGVVQADGDLDTMTVGPDQFVFGDDMAGQVLVGGTLTELRVAGGTPGTIVAGHVGGVRAYGGFGPLILQINDNGIQRRVEAAVPANPYPLLAPPPAPTPAVSPAGVVFQYFYESGSLADPQLTARITNTSGNSNPDQYDLSLVVYSDPAKFNLARLDSSGVTGLRNVAVEGDLLTGITAAAASFFGLTPDSPGGVQLPLDTLAGVAVRDHATAGTVRAAGIQGVAFGSLTEGSRTVQAAAAGANDAASLLAAGTTLVQANDTFRVPFADALRVAFFLDTGTRGRFDSADVLFTDQVANDARGAVIALVTVAATGSSSTIQRIDLRGDGGAVQTDQPIRQALTSTGPLGDLILGARDGIVADVTAPSLFGNIDAGGPIAGTIQTTGLEIDPITGEVTVVAADFGRVLTDASGRIIGTTTVQASAGLPGRLISRGDLISAVTTHQFSGLIAAQGDIGAIQRNPDGTAALDAHGHLLRFGSIYSNGGVRGGQIVALGNIFADILAEGGLRGSQIVAEGRAVAGLDPARLGILGNVTIHGIIDGAAAVVSGGRIGDAAGGTVLSVGNNKGIVAAKGAINFDHGARGAVFANATGVDAAAIDAIFTEDHLPLLFDLTSLDLGGLALILRDLAALSVDGHGHLTGPLP